jgi:hypothetical protein
MDADNTVGICRTRDMTADNSSSAAGNHKFQTIITLKMFADHCANANDMRFCMSR